MRSASFADHFSQARLFFRSQTSIEQAHIASALVFELSKVTLLHVQQRVVGQLRNIDEDLAKRVAQGIGIPLPEKVAPAKAPIDMETSDALSIVKKMSQEPRGRTLGILFADGSDKSQIDDLKAAAKKAGVTVKLIAPHLKGVKTKGGTMDADGQLAGTPSCTVDGIALILTSQAAEELCSEGAAVQFVMDAFGHLKAIGASKESQPLLDRAGVVADAGLIDLSDELIQSVGKRFFDREPNVRKLA